MSDSDLRARVIRLAHEQPALRPALREAAEESNWTTGAWQPVTVKAGSYGQIAGRARVSYPKMPLAGGLARVSAVAEFKPDGDMNEAAWWSGSGYFAEAIKKRFGLGGKMAGPAVSQKNLGEPIGIPDAAARRSTNPTYMVVFTGG